MKQFSKSLSSSTSLGFVPTMGYLHEGHLSLIRQSNSQCDHTCVSIFVNPTQFAAGEDLEKYPKDEKGDLDLISSQASVVFIPSEKEMYPSPQQIFVTPFNPIGGNGSVFTEHGEGGSRPSFLVGVCTVVSKLINIVQPSHAFFGSFYKCRDGGWYDILYKIRSEGYNAIQLPGKNERRFEYEYKSEKMVEEIEDGKWDGRYLIILFYWWIVSDVWDGEGGGWAGKIIKKLLSIHQPKKSSHKILSSYHLI